VIGTFTDSQASTADLESRCRVYFFRIRAATAGAGDR
jgi:hypothetical protein